MSYLKIIIIIIIVIKNNNVVKIVFIIHSIWYIVSLYIHLIKIPYSRRRCLSYIKLRWNYIFCQKCFVEEKTSNEIHCQQFY